MALTSLVTAVVIVLLCNATNSSITPTYECVAYEHIPQHTWKSNGKYCGKHSCYYPNSDATFQALLLQAGDISSNPGPTDDKQYNSNQSQTGLISQSISENKHKYSREELYNLNPLHHASGCKQRLPRPIWETINSLGIANTKKTRRGRRSRAARPLSISTSSSDDSNIEGRPLGPTDDTNYNSNTVPACLKCRKAIHLNQKGITCVGCKSPWHLKCTSIPLSMYDDGSTNSQNWECIRCDHQPDEDQQYTDNDRSQREYQINIYTKGLKLAHINIHSLLAKYDHLKEKLVNRPFDVFTVSETLLDDSVVEAEIHMNGFTIERADRNRHGGGVAVYVSNELVYTRRYDLEIEGLESLWVEVKLKNSTHILIGTFYRPPSSNVGYQMLIGQSFNRATSEQKELYILGDFNWDMYCRNSKFVKQLCNQNDLKQIINFPTRITETSTSLIDLIFTNTPKNVCESKVLSEGLSDHSLVYVVRKMFKPKIPPKTVQFRSYKKFKEADFINDLRSADLNYYLGNPDFHAAWNSWKAGFLRVCDKHAPCIIRRVRGEKTPWVTEEFIDLSRNRDRLKLKAEKSRSTADWKQYRSVRNYVNNLRQTLKKDYYQTSILENRKNSAKLWKVLKTFTTCDTKLATDQLIVNGDQVSDTLDMANEFNNFFVSVGARLASNFTKGIECNINEILTHIANPVPGTRFVFEQIGEQCVSNIMKKLQTTKAKGLDGLDTMLLKTASPIICTHLTSLFNRSLDTGFIPDEWKRAKVTPIHKGGEKHDPNNYRPISVIPVVMKIFERLVHTQVQDYFLEHNLLASEQSGFRKNHSTNTVLTYLSDHLYKQMDHGRLTGVVFLDLKKAFDSVDHDLLLHKLTMYGILGTEYNWFENYLKHRSQCTSVKTSSSELKEVQTGVPQGSILGPLLFTIMVNDMPNVLKKCKIMLYADDTVLVFSAKCAEEIETEINADLQRISKWLVANRLTLNPEKSKFMLFGTSNKLKNANPLNVKVDSHILERVPNFKYLGTWLDESLTWQKQVEVTSRKIGSRIALLSRLRKYLTVDSAKLLANALITPHFDYCSSSWVNCSQYIKNILITQHKKMARLVLKCNFMTPTVDVLSQLKWVTIEERWKFQKCKLLYNAVTGEAPKYISDMFTKSNSVHTHRTRGATSQGLVVPMVKTQMGKKSFSHEGSLLWNGLPSALKNAPTKEAFTAIFWRLARTHDGL